MSSAGRHWALAFGLILAGCATAPETTAPPPAADGRPALVAYALSLEGVPYRDGGEAPDQGFDCSGFVRHVYHRYGIALPRDAASMARVLTRVAPASARPGDLVFFDTRGWPDSHVGIYIGQDRFVHAPSRATGAVRVSRLRHPYWRARLSGVRRAGVRAGCAPCPTD